MGKIALGGFTYSALKNAVFFGFWWSYDKQRWVRDKIILFIIDYYFHVDDPVIIQHLNELKNVIRDAYRRYGSEQEEIWLILHGVKRFVS